MLLIEKIAQIKNLNYAWGFVKKKGKSGGIDRQSIDDYEKNLDRNLEILSKELLEHKYIPEPSLSFKIPKSNHKLRNISIITIKDKIVQRAFVIIIEPILEKQFSSSSYAYRASKGHQKALKRVIHSISNLHCKYFLTMDIRNYFDSIDHTILLDLFEKKVTKEPQILYLVKIWLRAGKVKKNDYNENFKGTPQGFVISPILANLYLDEFDHLFDSRNCNFVRYADNFIWASNDYDELKKIFSEAKDYLNKNRKLSINYSEYQLTSIDKGFSFLGIFFRREQLKINYSKMIKAYHKIYNITSNDTFSKDFVIDKINQATYSWRYYYRIVKETEQKELIDFWIIDCCRNIGFNKAELYKIRYLTTQFNLMIERKLDLSSKIKTLKNKIFKKNDYSDSNIKNKLRSKRKFYKKKFNLDGEFLLIKQGVSLRLYQNSILVIQKDFKISVPLNKVKVIQIPSNNSNLSTNLITECSKYGIPIFLTDNFGNPTSQILPNKFSFVNRIMKQIEFSNNEKGLELAKIVVKAKIKNQLNVIKYFGKYWSKKSVKFYENLQAFQKYVNKINEKIDTLDYSKNYSKIVMGYEGTCATMYWNLFAIIIKKNDFVRQKQHAKDPANAMLNYGYGILYHRITKKIVQLGLNPCSSFLHTEQNNRPSLVYDLIEPFRAIAVDRVVASIFNLRMNINIDKNGLFTEETRKIIAKHFLNRLHSRFNYKDSDTSIAEQIDALIEDYVKHIEENKRLNPFIWRY